MSEKRTGHAPWAAVRSGKPSSHKNDNSEGGTRLRLDGRDASGRKKKMAAGYTKGALSQVLPLHHFYSLFQFLPPRRGEAWTLTLRCVTTTEARVVSSLIFFPTRLSLSTAIIAA